jgi:hypothetical protein
MKRAVAICLLGCISLAAQRFPAPTELPSNPFFVKKTWTIGGIGSWDYLTMDPAARRLYIAHSQTVQVVDVETGTLSGEIGGFLEAHAVALDSTGQFGWVSDSRASDVKVFDRGSLQVVADLPVPGNPRALAIEPQTGLLFAVGPIRPQPVPDSTPRPSVQGQASAADQSRRPARPVYPCGVDSHNPPAPRPESFVSVIDTDKRAVVANIGICGSLGFAQADGNGQVFVTSKSPDGIVQFDGTALLALARGRDGQPDAPGPNSASGTAPAGDLLHLDWRGKTRSATPQMRLFGAGQECHEPRALAADGRHQRLFVACDNMRMMVLNTGNGEPVANLPIGPGADAVGYDPDRGLIFVANGGADGSLTIVRQTVTDSYAVIQNLATRQNARTLAIDPASGQVYLVTALSGVKLDHPPLNGLGKLKTNTIDASFQVLAIGH